MCPSITPIVYLDINKQKNVWSKYTFECWVMYKYGYTLNQKVNFVPSSSWRIFYPPWFWSRRLCLTLSTLFNDPSLYIFFFSWRQYSTRSLEHKATSKATNKSSARTRKPTAQSSQPNPTRLAKNDVVKIRRLILSSYQPEVKMNVWLNDVLQAKVIFWSLLLITITHVVKKVVEVNKRRTIGKAPRPHQLQQPIALEIEWNELHGRPHVARWADEHKFSQSGKN